MARKEVKRKSLGADDKPQVTHQLRGKIYFELTLTASAASTSNGKCSGPTLPLLFVQNHRDKVRGSTTLQMESSTVSWPVNLSVYKYSPTRAQVRFSGGWRGFAIANGLLEGDQLIFELTAMSEFKVYVFPSSERPDQPPPVKERKRIRHCYRSLEIDKKPDAECGDEQLGGDEEGSADVSNGWMVVKRKRGAANDPSYIPGSPPPCTRDGLNHRPAFKETSTDSNVCRKG